MNQSSADTTKTLDQTGFATEGTHAEEDTLDALVWIIDGISDVLVARRWRASSGDFRVDWCVPDGFVGGQILYLELVGGE